MGTITDHGHRRWGLRRDDAGHREFKVTHRLSTTDPRDGPYTILQAGPYQVGDPWAVDNDADFWAWCRPETDVQPVIENEPNLQWDVTYTFSTKPPDKNAQRCNDSPIEDPLLELPKISGSFTNYQEPAVYDRWGFNILNSALEQITGPKVEFDKHRATVSIEMNVVDINLPLLAVMTNTVNALPMWGMPPRTIKMAPPTWEKKYRGFCEVYYHRKLEFEIRADGFDRDLEDKGSQYLNGHWDQSTGTGETSNWVLDDIDGAPPDRFNPQHFIRAIDYNGNPRKDPAILDGQGQPASSTGKIDQRNFAGTAAGSAWTDPSNATGAPDGNLTTTLAGEFLDVDQDNAFTLTNFGFALPLNGRILGVVVVTRSLAEFSALSLGVGEPYLKFRAQLVSSGSAVGTTNDGDISVTGGDEFIGGPGDKWGTSLTPAVVNSSTFGVQLVPYSQVNDGFNKVVSLDSIEIRVFYKDVKQPGKIHVEKYDESNFFLLGIPITL